MPASLFRELPLTENGFGLDTEVTALLLARGERPYEVPISYKARSREEGKKLTWGDGVDATWILLRVRARQAIMNRAAHRRAHYRRLLPSHAAAAAPEPRRDPQASIYGDGCART